jgi:hypothetical protein
MLSSVALLIKSCRGTGAEGLAFISLSIAWTILTAVLKNTGARERVCGTEKAGKRSFFCAFSPPMSAYDSQVTPPKGGGAYLELFVAQMIQFTASESLGCQLDKTFVVKVKCIDDKRIPQPFCACDHDSFQVCRAIVANQAVVWDGPDSLQKTEPRIGREELIAISLQEPSLLLHAQHNYEIKNQ